MSQIEIVVAASGLLRMVYDDRFDLRAVGQPTISRGSQVEPTADGRWTADLHPVGGPILGPFDFRREALAAELAWLQRHWLTPSGI